jgi:putative membrane protein
MQMIAKGLAALVAVEHLYFWLLESVLWTAPLGLSTFDMTAEQAAATASLAFNQGFYNGFLAIGLLWSLWGIADRAHALANRRFFLLCVIAAAVVGGASVSMSILAVQGLPAVLALAATFAAQAEAPAG